MLEFTPVRPGSNRWLWIVTAFIIVVGIGLPLVLTARSVWGARSLGYGLDPAAVTIRYAPATITIDRGEISRAYVLNGPTKRLRVAGTAMPGLYQGRWSFAETGRIELYASDLSRVVVLETRSGAKWGISPADPDGFVQALTAGQTGDWAPVPAGGFNWILLLPLIEVPVLGLVLWLVWYFVPDPRLIRYLLTDDALLITAGARRQIRVPYAAMTGVTIASPKSGPMKIGGAALPGLYWGTFLWRAAGPNLKLYATRYKPLVLITTEHATYGLSPEEPERFVTELQQR